jgi:hypothetical protein
MAFFWDDERLLKLSPARLEVLRRNAVNEGQIELAGRIVRIQESRKPKKLAPANGPKSPVIGFHFKCENDYEVTLTPEGNFWSGVWTVDDSQCDPAIKLGGYVALHHSKKEHSYRQGTLVDWKVEPRSKGKTPMGVSFLVVPFEDSLPWFGNGSGEKGYRRVSDSPEWIPKLAK